MSWSKELKSILQDYGVSPEGVLHIGANVGQEVPRYKEIAFKRIVLVEPLPDLCAKLREFPAVEVVQAAVGQADGKAKFYRTNRDTKSSLLEPLPMRKQDVVEVLEVEVQRLEDFESPLLNVLVIDAQGSELDVLYSGLLDFWEMIVVEVRFFEQYKGQNDPDLVEEYLRREGFGKIREFKGRHGRFSDLVFKRRSFYPEFSKS